VGLLKMRAEVLNGAVKRITTEMTPAFFYGSYTVDLPGMGVIPIDISYGLNFFEPMINAKKLGIDVNIENGTTFEKIGLAIRDWINKNIELRHPEDPTANKVKQVQFYDPEPAHPGVNCRSLVVVGPGAIDLTPSGTSTCAHMAYRFSKGELGLNEEFVMESVVDEIITGRIMAETKVGDNKAIIPIITGYAYISRLLTIVI
jgi:proline racemase